MSIAQAFRNLFGNADRSAQSLAEIREGIANLTDVLDRRLTVLLVDIKRGMDEAEALQRQQAAVSQRFLEEIRDGVGNLTDVTNRRLEEVRDGVANMTDVTNRRVGEVVETDKHTGLEATQLLREVRNGIANLTDVINQRLASTLSAQPADIGQHASVHQGRGAPRIDLAAAPARDQEPSFQHLEWRHPMDERN